MFFIFLGSEPERHTTFRFKVDKAGARRLELYMKDFYLKESIKKFNRDLYQTMDIIFDGNLVYSPIR